MKLYHGSKQIIREPIVGGSDIHNDYGPSFYVTTDIKAARQWACRNDTQGYVNEYEFDPDGLSLLDLTDHMRFSVLHWIAILLHFRELDPSFLRNFSQRVDFIEKHFFIDPMGFDYIKGYRADDAYFRFPLDFIRGNITLEQLSRAFELGDLGIQYALNSEAALSRLRFRKAEVAGREYIGQYYANILNATKTFDEFNRDEEGVRILDLMRERA